MRTNVRFFCDTANFERTYFCIKNVEKYKNITAEIV